MQDTEVFFRVYKRFVSSGLIAALGGKLTVTLIALTSYMNKDGVCFPTQKQLAKDIGVKEQTVNEYIKLLKQFRWNDKPIVTVERGRHRKSAGWDNCTYRIHPEAQIAIIDGGITEIMEEANTAPFLLFCCCQSP